MRWGPPTTEWSWYRRLNGHNLPENQFLFPPGTDLFISSEDNVDGFRRILEHRIVRFVPLVVLFGFFTRWLVLLVATGIAECSPEVVAINCRMIGTWMPWAFLLQELFELLLRCCLPAS
jgi:fatty acid desaturase